MRDYTEATRTAARSRGYADTAADAATEYLSRRDRGTNPPGRFDSAGRFTAAERTDTVCGVRTPSRAYPYPELTAARTAKHCAEVYQVERLAVIRIARALESAAVAGKLQPGKDVSAHARQGNARAIAERLTLAAKAPVKKRKAR